MAKNSLISIHSMTISTKMGRWVDGLMGLVTDSVYGFRLFFYWFRLQPLRIPYTDSACGFCLRILFTDSLYFVTFQQFGEMLHSPAQLSAAHFFLAFFEGRSIAGR